MSDYDPELPLARESAARVEKAIARQQVTIARRLRRGWSTKHHEAFLAMLGARLFDFKAKLQELEARPLASGAKLAQRPEDAGPGGASTPTSFLEPIDPGKV